MYKPIHVLNSYQVSERQHVRGLFVKHEEHGGRPRAYAFHRRQAAYDVVSAGGGVHQGRVT